MDLTLIKSKTTLPLNKPKSPMHIVTFLKTLMKWSKKRDQTTLLAGVVAQTDSRKQAPLEIRDLLTMRLKQSTSRHVQMNLTAKRRLRTMGANLFNAQAVLAKSLNHSIQIKMMMMTIFKMLEAMKIHSRKCRPNLMRLKL